MKFEGKRPRFSYTLGGTFAIVMWGFGPVYGIRLKEVEAFYLVGSISALAFCLALLSLSIRGRWGEVQVSPNDYLVGGILLFVNQVSYLSLFRYVQPDIGELFYYIWPIVFSITLNKGAVSRWRQGGIAMIGFLGLGILNGEALMAVSLADFNWMACLCTVAAVSSWCLYLHRSSEAGDRPGEVVGLYSGVSALLALLAHGLFERGTPFPTEAFPYVLLAGLGSGGIAFFCWDTGIRRGNASLLATLAYFVPLISITILVLLGEATASVRLFFATLLVTAAALLSKAQERKSA